MTTVRCNPSSTYTRRRRPTFSTLADELFNFDIGNFVGTDSISRLPRVNVAETSDNYEIYVAAAGLTKDSFDINVEKNILTISADETANEDGDTRKYKRREFSYRKFKRSFRLPNTIETASITARYENGILTLTLPKKEEAKEPPTRKIEIH